MKQQDQNSLVEEYMIHYEWTIFHEFPEGYHKSRRDRDNDENSVRKYHTKHKGDFYAMNLVS